MTYRKKWARVWDEVRYCSDACRAKKLTQVDVDLENAIRALLRERSGDASICPSEAARRVAGDTAFRALMEPARAAARRLVAGGEIVITQGGRVVDPSTARGPIRLRRAR